MGVLLSQWHRLWSSSRFRSRWKVCLSDPFVNLNSVPPGSPLSFTEIVQIRFVPFRFIYHLHWLKHPPNINTVFLSLLLFLCNTDLNSLDTVWKEDIAASFVVRIMCNYFHPIKVDWFQSLLEITVLCFIKTSSVALETFLLQLITQEVYIICFSYCSISVCFTNASINALKYMLTPPKRH